MIIDHMSNPLGVVRRFGISYGDGLCLEGRVHGITEEGHSDVSWYEMRVVYPTGPQRERTIEVPEYLNNYRELKRGAPTLPEAEELLRKWCEELDLPISALDKAA